MVPLAPRAFPFSQLSFCLFTSPTSLSTSFILTFKISKSILKCHKHRLCYLPGFGMRRSQHTGSRGPGICAGDSSLSFLLQGHTTMLLASWLSFILTMPDPILFFPESHRIAASIPLIRENHSCLPRFLIFSPASFLLRTSPPVSGRGCQGR